MEHSIKLSDQAYKGYEVLASRLGLTVAEYLNQSAPDDAAFILSPEMRAGIERGLAQAEAGQIVSHEQVRESLAMYRAEWIRSKNL